MPSLVREWRIRIHKEGTDVPNDASVAFTLDEERLTGPPNGIGSQQLQLLRGQLVSLPYSIQVADPNGEITAKLFSGGRLRIIGRWAEVQTRVDGGSWARADLRRISRASSPDPVTWEFEFTADSSLLRDILCSTTTHVQLYPLGTTKAWHRQAAAGLASSGTVLDVDGDFVQVKLESTLAVPKDMVGVVRDNFDGLKMEVDGTDYDVISFGSSSDPADLDEEIGFWVGDPPHFPSGVWIEWPDHTFSADDDIGEFRLYWPDGVPTSPVTPYLIGPVIDPITAEVQGNGYRLDALVEDVLGGTFGGRRMPYDADAVDDLGDLGDEGHWFAITAPVARGDFLREFVWRPYLIAPQTKADGTLNPVAVWAGDSVPTTGLYVFDADNVAGAVGFEAGGSEIANVWRLKAQHGDPRLTTVAEVLPDLDLSDVVRVETLDPAPTVEEPYELAMGQQVMRRVWSEAMPDLYSARVFALAGDGATAYRLSAAVESTSPAPGDQVVLRMAELQAPEAQTATRSGDRIAVVIDRTRVYGEGTVQYDYVLWDAGWRAHSTAHTDDAHADTHSDSNEDGHWDFHADQHADFHTDVSHSDSHGDSSHSDSHTDGSHTDSHGDTADHTDVHVDETHGDAHTDTQHSDQHIDAAHDDSHGDISWHESDGHCDVNTRTGTECFHDDTHGDSSHNDSHSDTSHTDSHTDDDHDDQHGDLSHEDSHEDSAHADSHVDGAHSDVHDDGSHADEHADQTPADIHQDGSHTDSHDDSDHTDWHDDADHGDAEHEDAHADDSTHKDTHTDDAHADTAHTDHGHFDAHTDESHLDSHDDTAHVDSDHVDTLHQDVVHADDHTDVAHDDVHNDGAHDDAHTDQEVANSHTDFSGKIDPDTGECSPLISQGDPCHSDTHDDVAVHGDTHDDSSHSDTHTDDAHQDTHSDAAHLDTEHGDTAHGDTEHADAHSDESTHQDIHSDTAEHGDVTHEDTAHGDTHADTDHTDSHDDTAHADSEHTDAHRDQVHADVHADLDN